MKNSAPRPGSFASLVIGLVAIIVLAIAWMISQFFS